MPLECWGLVASICCGNVSEALPDDSLSVDKELKGRGCIKVGGAQREPRKTVKSYGCMALICCGILPEALPDDRGRGSIDIGAAVDLADVREPAGPKSNSAPCCGSVISQCCDAPESMKSGELVPHGRSSPKSQEAPSKQRLRCNILANLVHMVVL